MKIIIEDIGPEQEDEVIIRCHSMNGELLELVRKLRCGKAKINLYRDGEVFLMSPEDIFYFESIDQKVFAYSKDQVYDVKYKLYELEEELPKEDFFRATKSTILNINHIIKLTPAFSGRVEALLSNEERMIVSRQYVADLKERLGL